MELIKITHLTKTYKTSKKEVEVLKDVNLTLPQSGLVIILGKSGSGKSTLLNIIGGIDKPTKGKIDIIRNHRDISPKTKSKLSISFIFQHYHLLENETPLFNVMLPALIQGFNKRLAEKQTRELISLFKLDESIVNKKTRLLSGGEKERIAVLRALITNPELILADEPTGALDVQNAIKTMNILKNASKKTLVVLVTHNNALAKQYADRIITLSDGRIINDETFKQNNDEIHRSKVSYKSKNNWTSSIVNHNLKKRYKRHIVSTLGMTVSLMFCYLLFGFSTQSNKAIDDVSKKHLDYGTCLIRKEMVTPSSSSLSLVKTLRPDEKEIEKIKESFPEFVAMPNYDAVFNNGELFIGNKLNNEIINSFVLNFENSVINYALIENNDIRKATNWTDVIVNKLAYELIKDKEIHYKVVYEFSTQIDSKYSVDYFEIEERLNIVGIADEYDFLAIPKIYFNYEKIDELFENTSLENLSDLKKQNISWKNIIVDSLPGDELSSYSTRFFLRDIKKQFRVQELQNSLNQEIKMENDALSIKEAISSLTLAATYGLDIFLAISLIGSVLIVGVFTYSAYVDDKKESSILSCLGAKNVDIVGIFASESLIVTFFSFLFSTVFSWLIEKPINILLEKIIDIPNLVKIPLSSFLGIKGFLPICVLVGSLFITIVFSAFPILLNKSISLKKELSDL